MVPSGTGSQQGTDRDGGTAGAAKGEVVETAREEAGEKQEVQKVRIGVFACCPESQKGDATVTFRNLWSRPGVSFDHNADGNFE